MKSIYLQIHSVVLEQTSEMRSFVSQANVFRLVAWQELPEFCD